MSGILLIFCHGWFSNVTENKGLRVCHGKSGKPPKSHTRQAQLGTLGIVWTLRQGCPRNTGMSPSSWGSAGTFNGAFLGFHVVFLSCGWAGVKAKSFPMIQFCHFQKTPSDLVTRVVRRKHFYFSTFFKNRWLGDEVNEVCLDRDPSSHPYPLLTIAK